VNAPRSYPNNSDSISVSGKAAQFTATNGFLPELTVHESPAPANLARSALTKNQTVES